MSLELLAFLLLTLLLLPFCNAVWSFELNLLVEKPLVQLVGRLLHLVFQLVLVITDFLHQIVNQLTRSKNGQVRNLFYIVPGAVVGLARHVLAQRVNVAAVHAKPVGVHVCNEPSLA